MQQVDDPPSLPVGTEVSAKYKGAFCEAKVRKVVRNIKVKVAYKQGLGSGIVSDDAIKGVLRVGVGVEVKHPDRREYVEATITKIQDCSQYTVVFDDGDITTLRRTALCLKSGRHFNESETLDQLPLTHPEHFGNPVIGGRRGRRSRHLHDDSSDEDEEPDSKEVINEKEEHIGKVVCVESTETKKKDKDKWFPGLVVAPTAQVTVRIRVKDEYLVRSFKDGRYYTVPKKEAMEFTRELAAKQDGPAVQAALEYLDNDTLPAHWDRDALFSLANSSSEYEGEFDSDSSDDEPREEKDHFVAQLYKYMDDRGTPLNKVPSIANREVDFYRLFRTVQKLGGYNRVTNQNQWKAITMRLGFAPVTVSVTNLVKQAYKKFLQPFVEFDRKLGCSMSMTPRNANRSKGRSLVRANSVASPKPEVKEVKPVSLIEESENTSESSMDATKSKRKTSTSSNKVKALVDKFEEKVKEEAEKAETVIVVVTSPAAAVAASSSSATTTAAVATVAATVSTSTSATVAVSAPATAAPPPTPAPAPAPAAVVAPKNTKVPPKDDQSAGSGSSKETIPVVSTKKEKVTKKQPPVDEKRGTRKRKEGDNTEKTTEVAAPNEFPVEVGDKLKVYYHEKKVTYEAKVIEISLQQGTPLYLVHYTGWNTRYDEWVPRERIAENLTNSKTKRSKGSANNQRNAAHAINHPNEITKSASGSKIDDKTSVTTLTTTPLGSKSTIAATKRGRGRSDSQPPRSTTPSSVASNSSRTKSPATPAAQRRTTRTQPGTPRRTSNNVSDISLQTDSDSDSDEPVKKPSKIIINTSSISNQSNQASNSGKVSSTKSTSSTAANSPSETEEDEVAAGAKGRDYDLNQIRSELKGFKELKSPSPEAETSTQMQPDKKPANMFDFNVTDDSGINKSIITPCSLLKSSESKSSSTDLSSETDSFADDDSQSSDKTTTLENMTEKLQQKIKAEKLAQAKSLERITAGKSPEKVTPIKSAGIEKIINDTLAEKIQESMKVKPFLIEKGIYKGTDKEEKPKASPDSKSQVIKSITPERKLIQTVTTPEKKPLPVIEVKSIPLRAERKMPNIEKPQLYAKLAQKELSPQQPEVAPQKPITILPEPVIKDSPKSHVQTRNNPTPDIYEFKEPEPFEFEVRKPLPAVFSLSEPEKKKKISPKASESMLELKPVPVPTSAAAKKNKRSPTKDPEKSKQLKLEEKSTVVESGSGTNAILLSPIKTETTFDVLRKSPSFNLNINALNEELATTVQETTKVLTDVSENPIPVILPSQQKAISFISPFIETKSDISSIFDLKTDIENIKEDNNDEKSSGSKTELETVKKILLSDASFDLEPPKVDKPSSIADKVLKALNQQKQDEEKLKEESDLVVAAPSSPLPSPSLASTSLNKSPFIEIQTITTSTSLPPPEPPKVLSTFSIITEPPKIELPAVIKKDLEIPVKKPILSSPEHKLDIFESIAPKNNDLSETIQKLESAIQKTSNVDHFDEDSSDSTDSERRLVIEDDDSQSSDNNQSEIIELPVSNLFKKTENMEEKSILIQDIVTKDDSPVFTTKYPSIFGLQTSVYSDVALLSDSGIKPIVELLPSLKSDFEVKQKPDLILPESSILSCSGIKKDESLSCQENLNMHNESINLLLCEETIPGSPTPTTKELSDIKMNMHPIESDIKPIPMDLECGPITSSVVDISSIKIHKIDNQTPSSSPHDSASQYDSSEDLKKQLEQDIDVSPKKKRRSRKHSECETLVKRRRTASGKKNNGSDSDDNSDANVSQRSSSSRSSRPCQYNFLVQLDPSLNPNQRISVLKKKIQELRKTYNMIKAEIASIDRRRKKLRRREREKKNQQKLSS